MPSLSGKSSPVSRRKKGVPKGDQGCLGLCEAGFSSWCKSLRTQMRKGDRDTVHGTGGRVAEKMGREGERKEEEKLVKLNPHLCWC